MHTIVGELVKKTKRLEREIGLRILGPKEKICSWNTKTGFSINLPIHGTCIPSKVCIDICYAAKPGKPITWNNSLLKNLRVLNYFKSTSTQEAADRIWKEYVGRKMTFIRWNGVGDLIPETVKVINLLNEQHPDMVQWVVTRKPLMAKELSKSGTNLYIIICI